MDFESRTDVSRLTLSAVEPSRAGDHAASEAVLAVVAIPRQCLPVLWVQVGSEARVATAAISAAVFEDVSAGSLVAVGSVTAEEASVAATLTVLVALVAIAAVVVTLAVLTDSLPLMRRMGPVLVVTADTVGVMAAVIVTEVTAAATTDEAPLDRAVMAVREAVAHMTIDLAEATATGTLDNLAATWNRSGLVERMVGIKATVVAAAAGTMTDLEITMTRGSAATMVATKIPGSCDATSKTKATQCLVVGIETSHFRDSLAFPFPPFRH